MWWGRWQQWHTFAAWYVGFYNDIISGLWSAALFLGDFFVGWMPHRYYTIRCEQVHWVLNSLSPQSLCHWSCSTLLSRDHAPSERLQQQAYIWCDFIELRACVRWRSARREPAYRPQTLQTSTTHRQHEGTVIYHIWRRRCANRFDDNRFIAF